MKALGFYLFLFVALSSSAAAQCLTLDNLLTLSQATSDSTSSSELTALLPDWIARGRVTPDDVEVYWVLPAPDGSATDSLAAGWLSLRPNHDVLYKFNRGTCHAVLRRELTRAHYPVTPVTTLDGGEGLRFIAPAFSITLYTRPKGLFQYAVVLRETTAIPKVKPDSTARHELSGKGRLSPRY